MKKIYMPLFGRLGNILFNIGVGLTLATKQNRELYITDFPGEDTKHTMQEVQNKEFFKWLKYAPKPQNCVEYIEDNVQHFVDIKDCDSDIYIQGFFQSEKYMDKDVVRDFFKITDERKKNIEEEFGDLSNAVSLHIRRGDFLMHPNLFCIPTKEWYLRCYHKYFDGKKVIITSDDINWAKKNIVIERGIFLENKNPLDTIYICSQCKHHIIDNSSFAWWCAWLNEQEDSIIVTTDRCWAKNCNMEFENRKPERWVKETVNNDYIS